MRKRLATFCITLGIFWLLIYAARELWICAQPFFAPLITVRGFLVERLQILYPEPSASLAAGLLMGQRSLIPQGILSDFRATGLMHVLALSGFNIVIIIQAVEAMLRFLPRRRAALVAAVIIVLFVLMVGPSSSVVRAAVMGCLTLVARMAGRSTSGLRLLAIAALAMILWEPSIALNDIGFQLSVGATAGLMLFGRPIEERLTWVPQKFGMRATLAATLAAQVFTTTIILIYFRNISLIAPLANLIVLPLIPLLMLGTAISMVIGKIAAAPTYLLYLLFLWLVHALAAVPWSLWRL